MTLPPFGALRQLGALFGIRRDKVQATLPVPRRATPPAPSHGAAFDIGRRLQERWRETGREPGVLLAANGDIVVVCGDGIRSRVGGVWVRGHFFTAGQMRMMRRPATRFERLRLQNEALQRLPQAGSRGDEIATSAMRALGELPHGIVRRAPNGDMYVRTFNFAASRVRGRWHVGNRFSYEERRVMAFVHDRVEREAIVTIARAALGVPRTDATYV